MDHSDVAATAARIAARLQHPSKGLQPFTEAVESSLAAENWYAALIGALVLPDICGKLASPDAGSKQRYIDWSNVYLTPKYSSPGFQAGGDGGITVPASVFLTGGDCYALRCAVLHEGVDRTDEQRAAVVLGRFHFVLPSKHGNVVHCNLMGTVLQLQVDVFCRDMLDGVKEWLRDVASAREIQERIMRLMQIFPPPLG